LITIKTHLSRSWTRLRRSKRLSVLLLVAGLSGIGVLMTPLPARVVTVEYSAMVTAADGSLLRAFLSRDEKWRFKTDTSLLPEHVSKGLICLEDKRFHTHPGVDPLALLRAAHLNIRFGRVMSGGSTLTMQLARLIEPRPRTLTSKALEALMSFRLEARLSKKEILDLYLTYAPFGGNLEGIEAASQRYFKKPALLLSPSEAAFLFLLPQSPHRWDRRDTTDLARLRNRNLQRMQDCGVINHAELAQFQRDPIPEWKAAFDSHAEHLANWVLQKSPSPNVTNIRTTLDRTLQSTLENLVKEREAQLRSLGILNVGLIVVENSTGAVRAAIGNFDYYRDGDSQKYASFLAPRSPGSLLKPLLYGALLEAGEILPETLLEDVPVDVDGYEPKNYDGEFSGLVEARLALSNSLNIPWIQKLRTFGVDSFLSFLLESGLKTPQKRHQLGLSVAIGGMEANLVDLVKLYRAVAADGSMQQLIWQHSTLANENEKPRAWRWLHPGAAHLVREAMRIRGRPDFAIDPKYLMNPSIRWKTGTSQGNHDAWAIGFTPEFTIGVWLGNLDNRPSPSLVGPEVAAPLMFDAFARVRTKGPEWHPDGVAQVEVCAFSGLPPGEACQHRKTVMGIKGLLIRHRCPYHHHALVDARSGHRITKDCEAPGMRPELRSVLELPPEVAAWARRSLATAQVSPGFHPKCLSRPFAKGNLEILTPEPKTYLLLSGLMSQPRSGSGSGAEPELSLPVKIKSAGTLESLRCYLNGKAIHLRPQSFAPLLKVTPGDHELHCTDTEGRSDRVAFSVER
jgi:penicillin-binding protein 1C